MRIAIPTGAGDFARLTNEGLAVGDKVFPLTSGWTNGRKYYVLRVTTDLTSSGWPSDPHTILDLNHGGSKSHEVRTDKGYGPRECYFKLMAREASDEN